MISTSAVQVMYSPSATAPSFVHFSHGRATASLRGTTSEASLPRLQLSLLPHLLMNVFAPPAVDSVAVPRESTHDKHKVQRAQRKGDRDDDAGRKQLARRSNKVRRLAARAGAPDEGHDRHDERDD